MHALDGAQRVRLGGLFPMWWTGEMARNRRARWLLFRLAAQNLARRRLRAIFLGVAVMIGVGVAFASFVAGWALRAGMICIS